MDCIAMILAGGQGSRLGALTKDVAKPAVSFGGKYRIIDFALSNCTHSGIDTVGVLTQYQPLELNTYIGNGVPWDLDRNYGGVFVLPPYQKAEKGEWYKGTANAIYQNISFIEQFNPDNVLILSGDHIYKMNYRRMLMQHIEKGAAATVAVMPVAWEEASRFGIMNTGEENNITDFEEKPKQPKSNLASMGIYIFNWHTLKKYLIVDENDPNSENDFGKNIIPQMLRANEKMYAYNFEGYWRDVGTVQSLWDAHMDMLSDPPKINVRDSSWVIYSRNPVKPPHFITRGAILKNSCITEGCNISGVVDHSVLSEGVCVESGAIVRDSVIMPNCTIGSGAIIEKTIIGPGTTIGENCVIGLKEVELNNPYRSEMCSDGIVLIGGGITIEEGTQIYKNSMVEKDISSDNKLFVNTPAEDEELSVKGGA